MRTILFRGKLLRECKNTAKDSWVTGDLITSRDDEGYPLYHINGFGEVKGYSLGQYIGLIDKNGKQIFEGDYIKKGNRIFLVEWIEEYAGFYPFFDQDNECGYGVMPQNCEVVGNIYDIPEL